MNSNKLSATSFGASIKKECLYFGKITNLESFISLAITSLCFGLQPPSCSPVKSKHGLEIFFYNGNISVFAYILKTLRKTSGSVSTTCFNLLSTKSGFFLINSSVNHLFVKVCNVFSIPFFSIS